MTAEIREVVFFYPFTLCILVTRKNKLKKRSPIKPLGDQKEREEEKMVANKPSW